MSAVAVRGLARAAAKRLLHFVFVVWATVTLTFVAANVLPSDPARMVAGPQARPQDVARIRKELGLDRSAPVRYALFMKRLVHVSSATDEDPQHKTCATMSIIHFDLGRSYQQRRPVVTILGERLPRTLALALAAVALQVVFGVASGALAAKKKGTRFDTATVTTSLVGISAPTFILGLALQWLLAVRLRLLPLDGFGQTLPEHAQAIVLPALTLGIFGAAYYTRLVRDEMRSELAHDYVRTARAKGMTEVGVMRHALANVALLLVTIIALDLGTLVGGAIVTESLFRWPGLGSLSVTAILDRDGPLVQGCVIVTSAAVVLANMTADALYRVLDPRTRR
jgi:peptide/nickel transport system permease protein